MEETSTISVPPANRLLWVPHKPKQEETFFSPAIPTSRSPAWDPLVEEVEEACLAEGDIEHLAEWVWGPR
jgi:hypothetical protein